MHLARRKAEKGKVRAPMIGGAGTDIICSGARCRSVSGDFVMAGNVLCAMRELPRGGPCADYL